MKRVKLLVETNYANVYWEDVVEFEDDEFEDLSPEELDQIAEEFMQDNVFYGWSVVD